MSVGVSRSVAGGVGCRVMGGWGWVAVGDGVDGGCAEPPLGVERYWLCLGCVVLLAVCCWVVVIGCLLTEVCYPPIQVPLSGFPPLCFVTRDYVCVCCRRCRFVRPPSSFTQKVLMGLFACMGDLAGSPA